MLRIAFFFLLNGFFATAFAQYTVVSVQGLAYQAEQEMAPAMILDEQSPVRVASDSVQVYLCNDSLAIFTLEATDTDQPLALCIQPLETKHRGFKRKPTAVSDLAIYFGNHRFVILGDSLWLPLDAQSYPLNEERYLVFQYRIAGESQAKRIAFDNQVLKIRYPELARGKTQVLEKPQIEKLRIFDYQPSTKISKKVAEFDLHFVPQQQVAEQCRVLASVGQRSGMPADQLRMQVEAYIYGRYGHTDPQQLEELIGRVFAK